MPHGAPYYVLIEALGGDSPHEAERFQSALADALDMDIVTNTAMARSGEEVAEIWALRDDVMQIARWGPPYTYDVALPIPDMPAYVDRVRADLHAVWPSAKAFVFGHLADCNLHLVISPDGLPRNARAAIERIVYTPLTDFNGAISAEHGIGFEKKGWLGISRTASEIALMRTLKHAMDPKNILNRGRIV